MDYFRLLGKLLAKSICDGITTPFAHFTPDVYNAILQKETQFSDLQVIDAEVYRSLQWVLNNDIADLGLTFVVDVEEWGAMRQQELKPGGKEEEVTEDNKSEFVGLKAKYIMVDRKAAQLKVVRDCLPDDSQSLLALPRDDSRMLSRSRSSARRAFAARARLQQRAGAGARRRVRRGGAGAAALWLPDHRHGRLAAKRRVPLGILRHARCDRRLLASGVRVQ
jgi:hypothetical protein